MFLENFTKNHGYFPFLSERLQVFTPNKHEFDYLRKPDALDDELRVSVRANNDVRIALSPEPHDNTDMYEVVLGGWANTMSWISLGKDGMQSLIDIFSCDISNILTIRFWLLMTTII